VLNEKFNINFNELVFGAQVKVIFFAKKITENLNWSNRFNPINHLILRVRMI